MPDFPIVDSHVHLYDVKRLRYVWLKNVPKIDRTYLLADFDHEVISRFLVEEPVFAGGLGGLIADPGIRRHRAVRT